METSFLAVVHEFEVVVKLQGRSDAADRPSRAFGGSGFRRARTGIGGAGAGAGLRDEFGHPLDFGDYFFDFVAAIFGGQDLGAGVVTGGGGDAHFPG